MVESRVDFGLYKEKVQISWHWELDVLGPSDRKGRQVLWKTFRGY